MALIDTIDGTDLISESRSTINLNFLNLNADKVETLSDLSITATATELNYMDGVTSNVQAQLDGKLAAMTGEIKMVAFGEGSIPSGWLICDGAEVSRTTYATLYSAIGDTYGSGNGSTTFNVPDLRGRVPAGIDSMGQGSANTITATEADSLGGEYGTETHTLTVDEMPAHTHDQATSTEGSSGGGTYLAPGAGATPTESAGGDQPHNNVQPTLFLNFIIRT